MRAVIEALSTQRDAKSLSQRGEIMDLQEPHVFKVELTQHTSVAAVVNRLGALLILSILIWSCWSSFLAFEEALYYEVDEAGGMEVSQPKPLSGPEDGPPLPPRQEPRTLAV